MITSVDVGDLSWPVRALLFLEVKRGCAKADRDAQSWPGGWPPTWEIGAERRAWHSLARKLNASGRCEIETRQELRVLLRSAARGASRAGEDSWRELSRVWRHAFTACLVRGEAYEPEAEALPSACPPKPSQPLRGDSHGEGWVVIPRIPVNARTAKEGPPSVAIPSIRVDVRKTKDGA